MFTLSRKLRIALALVAAWSFGTTAQAQTDKTTWTLQECIDYALKNNLQIKQFENSARLTGINNNTAKANRLPSVNASTSYGRSYGRSIDPTENTFTNQQISSNNFSVNASVPLFNGFQIQNNIKRSQVDNEAAQADVQTTRNDVMLNIVSAYVQIIFSDELVQNARAQLNSTQSQAERTQKLFRAGSVAESNVLEINALVASDELAIINAQNQKDIAELNLMQLLDLKKVKDFEVVKPTIPDPDQSPITLNPENIYETAQQNMPQVRGADLRVKSALLGIDVARGAYFPRLSLGGSISTNYSSARLQQLLVNEPVTRTVGFVGGNPNQPVTVTSPFYYNFGPYSFFNQLTDNQGKSIFLSLNIPILNGLQTRYSVSRARINHQTAVLDTEISRNRLRQNIQQAYANAQAAQKKFVATRRQVEALQLTFRNAEIRFNNGLLNATEYNVARNNLVRAQSDLISAKYDYTFKLKILDFYQGKPLAL